MLFTYLFILYICLLSISLLHKQEFESAFFHWEGPNAWDSTWYIVKALSTDINNNWYLLNKYAMPGLVLCVIPKNKCMAMVISLEKIIIMAIVRNKIIETNHHDHTNLSFVWYINSLGNNTCYVERKHVRKFRLEENITGCTLHWKID